MGQMPFWEVGCRQWLVLSSDEADAMGLPTSLNIAFDVMCCSLL